MTWLEENVLENPMMAEVMRLKQVIKGRSRGSMSLRLGLILAIIIAAMIVMLGFYTDGAIEPILTPYAQLTFCIIVIPLLFYGTIAGEREKRSWDLLRAAPVTNLQLVIGKFAAMAYVVALIHLVFAFPFVLSTVSYAAYRTSRPYGGWYSHDVSFVDGVTAESYSFLFSLFVAALTLFFSARSKRSYTALALTFGSLIAFLIFAPMFLQLTMRAGDSPLDFLNPFSALGYLAGPRGQTEEAGWRGLAIVMGIACFAFLIFALVIYASSTIAFADNAVRFLPKKKPHHA
jgi:ABC-type transport system involved in multi-copper enzyme maturation permease subunit